MKDIDWGECALIETVPGKRGGKPVIKATRFTRSSADTLDGIAPPTDT